MLADVLIRDGLIHEVGLRLEVPDDTRVIDATGSYVMPGGIDPHTHLSMPFMGQLSCEDFFSGQSAALAGGTTHHIDFVLPVEHDLLRGLESWKVKAESACMDYSFHMAVNQWNHQTESQMEAVVEQGINSFKFFMAYKGALMVSDSELLEGFAACKRLGALPMVHAENGDGVEWGRERVFAAGVTGPEGHSLSRPPVLEGEATGRAIRLAAFVGTPLYVVHVTSIDALREVAQAQLAGQPVIGEPVVSGLYLEESRLWDRNFTHAAQYVMSPPIRSAEHGVAIKQALAGGVLTVVATDHCAWNSSQKAMGRHDFRLIPNGVNGIEERLHVLWQQMVVPGLMTPSAFVSASSTAAARAFNLFPRKGLLAAGSDADVIVFDPRVTHTLGVGAGHSAMDTNLYEGMQITGKVTVTVSRGVVVWENGVLTVVKGAGQFVPTPPHAPLFSGLRSQGRPGNVAAWPTAYGPTPVLRDGDRAQHAAEACAA
ncbi:MAG: hypothetical protein WDW38_011104 [Sanguina aurantia]